MTTESADILCALQAGDLVVGVSGYTVMPGARRTPKVGADTSVDFEKIFALNADLVIAYSKMGKMGTDTVLKLPLTIWNLTGSVCSETVRV